MPRRNPPTVAPSRPAYGGPPVMGPGQGMLPLGPRDDVMGPFGTGQRGQGPALPPDVGPFEQTGTDIMNLFNTGSTAPHWSSRQMSQMYGLPLYQLLGKTRRGQAGTAITSAELDRMYRNVSGGLGYYGGQLQDMFGGGGQLQDMFGGVPGFAQGGDFMTNGPQMIMVGDNPGGRERVQIDPMTAPPGQQSAMQSQNPRYVDPRNLTPGDRAKTFPGLFGPGVPGRRPPTGGNTVWPEWPSAEEWQDIPPGQMPLPPARPRYKWWNDQQPWGGPFYDPKFPPNKVYTDPKTVSGIPGTPTKRDATIQKMRDWLKRKILGPAPPPPVSELF